MLTANADAQMTNTTSPILVQVIMLFLARVMQKMLQVLSTVMAVRFQMEDIPEITESVPYIWMTKR